MSIAEVQARIAAITAQFSTPVATTAGTAFASQLASARSDASVRTTSAQSAVGNPGDSTAGSSATGTAAELITDAKRYLGVPYVWGGTDPATGLDCSGFTQLVYGHVGVSLPRVSWEQAKTGTAVDGLANAKPGDLLAFGSPVDHVAIYLGDHKMIQAPHTGEDVEISDVYKTPSAIRRVLPDEATSTTSALQSMLAGNTSGLTAANWTALQKLSALGSSAGLS